MQLKSLELFGFKSFADKTKLIFDKGITGIVGPNGCGKSNVIDAIRWVLGEQSTKNLRSEKMDEVIFNGTEKRKRTNLTEVSITFENTKDILPSEFSSVTITRRLYRDGGSEYFLNHVPCRLKDIESLLMDTGIGPDSYAIIELKMVDELLNDKNNTRRELFDEAAGISKYKIRKKETLKRLESTEQDLQRIEDVLHEIDKNLKTLEKQAKRAEKYFELKKDYQLNSSRFAYIKLSEIKKLEEQLQNDKLDFLEKEAELQAQIAQYEAKVHHLQKDLIAEEEHLVYRQKQLNEILDVIKKIESEKNLRKERIKFLEERKNGLIHQISKEKSGVENIQQDFESLEQRLDQANEVYDKSEFYLQELEENLEYLKNLQAAKKAQLEDVTLKYQKKQNVLSVSEKNLTVIKLKLDALDKELQKNLNEKEDKNSELDSFDSEIEKLKNKIVEVEKEIVSLNLKLENEKSVESSLKEQLETYREEQTRFKILSDKKKNEYQLIKSLIDNLEGFPESIKFLSKKKDWAKNPVLLSDIFSCDDEFKIALELFLEPWMNFYVVDTYEEALNAIQILDDKNMGRVNFFVLQEIQQWNQHFPAKPVNVNLPKLQSMVTYDSHYNELATYLFSNAFLIPVGTVHQNLPLGGKYLSQSGKLYTQKTQFIGGSVGLFEGKKIGRAKDLEKIQKELSDIEGKLLKIVEQQKSTQELLAKVQIKTIENQIKDTQNQINTELKNLSILEFKQKEFHDFLKKSEKQREQLEQEFQKLKADALAQTEEYEKLQDDYNQLSDELASLSKSYQKINDEFSEVNQQYNKENLQFIEAKNTIQSIRQEIKFKREKTEKIKENLQEWQQELELIETELSQIHEEIDSHTDDLVLKYEQKFSSEKLLNEQEEKVRLVKSEIQKNDSNIREQRSQKEFVEKQLSLISEQLTDCKLQINSVTDRLNVEFGLNLSELDPMTLFENPEELPSYQDLEKQVISLRDKIHNFGEVNTLAVEAYQEMKERFDFIVAQRVDILKAKQDLLTTISEIDKNAREQFLEAFTTIRDNFIRVFRSLFTSEDTCDLILVNPENPTESSIDIIAKPKGKRPLNINQLSGGEKTLTATSLLFAIYLYKPAPFCIFDEVDAPLDDANIDKFNNIIRDFSKESQFIIVTHNKRTMVTTNVIYGVTMEEMGVSKVLPVSLVDLNLN